MKLLTTLHFLAVFVFTQESTLTNNPPHISNQHHDIPIKPCMPTNAPLTATSAATKTTTTTTTTTTDNDNDNDNDKDTNIPSTSSRIAKRLSMSVMMNNKQNIGKQLDSEMDECAARIQKLIQKTSKNKVFKLHQKKKSILSVKEKENDTSISCNGHILMMHEAKEHNDDNDYEGSSRF